ncbi:MAG: hypothetical protein K2N51_06645 [Lachnospiraceae bacterium]|nr:hypothetical protein [Lachnospiraceae bacterium]
MSLDFRNPDIGKYMLKGNFGLEKECLRVTPDGFLAHTEHPFINNPNIERDFCENQVELITDVSDSIDEVFEELALLQKKAVKTLQNLETGKELLWPFSNPPYILGEQDIPIANYKGTHIGKELYREYLAQKYGKKKMLFSGIHFNFSFSKELMEKGYRESNLPSLKEYKNKIYLELAKKITKYSWLIVYLTAASPVMDGSFFRDEDKGKVVLKNLASPRCSKIGYWNDFIPLLDYDTMQSYIRSIEAYVEQGQLKEAMELYYPVRLKPAGENSLENLKKSGVNHIELRMLDLNPLESVGIGKTDLKFLHLFIVYLMFLKDEDFSHLEQTMAIKNEKRAAKYEEQSIWIETGWNTTLPVRQAVLDVLDSMEHFFESFGKMEFLEVICFQREKILYPQKRYAVQVKEKFQEDYVKQGVMLAEKYAYELGQ